MKVLRAIYLRYLLLVLSPFVLIIIAGLCFHEFVLHAILNNTVFNGIIIATACGGVLLMMLRLRAIHNEWSVFNDFLYGAAVMGSNATNKRNCSVAARLLIHLEHIRRTRQATSLEKSLLQEELEDVHRVLDTRQEVAQYVVGLMIALGLLGTFIGLLETLLAVGQLIGGFSNTGNSDDLDAELAGLIGNLQYPLTAMGTAFSASMFGLLCSLMLGVMLLSVRAFQAEFLQFARSVVGQMTTSTNLLEDELQNDHYVDDPDLWLSRTNELQHQQQNINEQIREIVIQSERSEKRQSQILVVMERLGAVAQKSEQRTQKLEEHLGKLPSLLDEFVNVSRATHKLNETTLQLQRQSAVEHQGLLQTIIYHIGEFTSQADYIHTEQAQHINVALAEMLNQHMSAIESYKTHSNVTQSSVMQLLEILGRICNAFEESNSGVHAQLQHLHDRATGQEYQLSTQKMTDVLTEIKMQMEEHHATMITLLDGSTTLAVANEVARGAERLERELRINLSAILRALRAQAGIVHESSGDI